MLQDSRGVLLPFAVEKAENKKSSGETALAILGVALRRRLSVCPRPVPQGSPAWFPHSFYT